MTPCPLWAITIRRPNSFCVWALVDPDLHVSNPATLMRRPHGETTRRELEERSHGETLGRDHKEKPQGETMWKVHRERPHGETLRRDHEEKPQEVTSRSTMRIDHRKRTRGETMRRGPDGERSPLSDHIYRDSASQLTHHG